RRGSRTRQCVDRPVVSGGSMSTIQISHLSKRFGQFPAVSDLSLEVPAGSVYGLLGPNGAGKTTVFKCVLGLSRPSEGEVLYHGDPFTPQTSRISRTFPNGAFSTNG